MQKNQLTHCAMQFDIILNICSLKFKMYTNIMSRLNTPTMLNYTS
jgi:hypothetical protein